MKKIFYYLIYFLLLVSVFSCKDDSIQYFVDSHKITFSVDIKNMVTKGTPIDSVNNELFREIGIYALQASDGYLFENIKVVKSSPYWSLENQYYWPQAGSLTFYGYFPLASQTNGISISKNSDSVPRIRYQVPSVVGDQPDLMIAQTKTNQYREIVDMTFSHALSCIAFDMTSEENDTIKSIGINGVYTSGIISIDYDGSVFTWDSLSMNDQTYTIGLSQNPQPITGNSIMANNGFLMLPPQVLNDNAEIVVEFTNIGTKTISLIQGGIDEWKAGYKYTYMLKQGKYVFDITTTSLSSSGIPTDTLSFVGGTYNLVIDSYFKDANGDSLDLGWDVSILSQTQYYNWSVTDIITELSDSAGGISINKSISCIKATPAQIISPKDFINVMRNRDVISKEDAVDLSNYISGKYCSANCYIVNQPGWHKFPCWIIGNGLSSSSTTSSNTTEAILNISCYNSSMVNYAGNEITSTNNLILPISDASCELLWQSPFDMITTVELSDDNQYIYFYVSDSNIAPGNALIAIKDQDGVIMWSWHIWISPWELKPYPNNGEKILFGLNIGTSLPQQYDYAQNNISLLFTQKSSGLTKEVVFVQNPDTIKIGINNTYYQWGRKDPMLPADSIGSDQNINALPSINDAIQFSSDYSLESSIKNPTIFYTGSNYTPKSTFWGIPYTNSTGNYKTIYDPSPIGSMLPSLDSSYDLQIKQWVSKFPGLLFSYVSGTIIFMPIGQRSGPTGDINNTNGNGYYWTNQESSTTTGSYKILQISQNSDSTNIYSYLTPDYGLSVMPVVDFGFFFGE